ncbi:MAG: ubiquinol-cytochrome c reductase cytochrome c1 subunit [Alphaproteobacteria bacterium]|jgi:ubiquinol-cytochrome c reductase cytochrome c1 subunit
MDIGKKFFRATAIAAVAGLAIMGASVAPVASGEAEHPEAQDWEFTGVFGKFDVASIQRGLQVYIEVCSSCHSLNQMAYRNLLDLDFNVDEVKAIAEQYEVTDGPDDNGDMFQRPARPSDKFVPPFPNEQAARASNNGAFPPDLSLITKAHPGGPDYVFALLTGFEDEAPEGVELGEGMNFNPYFSGQQIAMSPPLFEDSVEYSDGTPATVENMSRDITNFLQWTAEPEMEDRKRIGWKVVLFLLVLSGLLYAAKRQTWAKLH